MRLGRQISHFSGVLVESVTPLFSDEYPTPKYRYLLSMNYSDDTGNRNKTATIILKNPSSADAYKADKTIVTAEKAIHIHFQDVGTLNVLNLFAIRGTDALDVGQRYREYGYMDILGDKNDEASQSCISASDYIITAWGGANGIPTEAYDRRISDVQTMLKNFRCPVFRKLPKGCDKYPFHACMWGYKEGFTLLN
ncbi:MAG: DUF1643 domain-containing protein [Campylobacterales bacterium]|nr:DUF1643 domain-containing protein [Campylobacterales bacterium]